ncbi:MAG: hypothetical protein HQK77_01910 [Desulfobacterales bacterium]|nr:hypothetical protein [Desulfobacterales bacterium]
MVSENRNFWYYCWKAFLFHWNLLVFFTGISIAILVGYPDIIIPLVLAAESIYLAGLASHPRFQAAIAASITSQQNIIGQSSSDNRQEIMLLSLNPSDQNRFERLKQRCIELREISDRINQDGDRELSGIKDIQTKSMNQLLWIYLKLLYTKNALDVFFKGTQKEEIEKSIAHVKKRIEALKKDAKQDLVKTKYRDSLEDTLKTLEMRWENFQTAFENYEFIGLELERLDSKIASIAEMGINRQDPDFITSEIDVVAHSSHEAEKAISELSFLRDFSVEEEKQVSVFL